MGTTTTGDTTVSRTSMTDALFTRTQSRVLGVLFGQPSRSFYTSEIFKLAGIGRGAVQRELARLAQSGLVTMQSIGNQKHYRANAAAPIFGELCSLVRKTSGGVEPIREALEPLAQHIRQAFIYGSAARGGRRSDSDIDLLIVGDGLTLEGVHDCLAPVEDALGIQIDTTLYTCSEFDSRRARGHHFLTRILAGETIPVLGEGPANPDAE